MNGVWRAPLLQFGENNPNHSEIRKIYTIVLKADTKISLKNETFGTYHDIFSGSEK